MTQPATTPQSPRSGPLSAAERRAHALGRRCQQRGDAEGALHAYRELLVTRGGFADVHYRVATLLDERGDLDGARRHLERALALNPGYVEALLGLASLCERQGDFDCAFELTERARARCGGARGRLDPVTRGKLANLQAELGDAYREAGELFEAIAAYRKCLDRCPHFHDVRHRLGMSLREAGRPDAALAEFRRVIHANPSYREAVVQLGLTLYSLGRSGEAIETWRAVLEAEPGRADAQMYLRLVAPRASGDHP